jgi:hypothetical protein
VKPASTKPGWGKGDPNHVHTGPPGHTPAAQTPPAVPATQDNGPGKDNKGNGDPGGGRDKKGK